MFAPSLSKSNYLKSNVFDEIVILESKISDVEEKYNKIEQQLNNIQEKKFKYLAHLISDFDYHSWLISGDCILSRKNELYKMKFMWDVMPHSYWLYLASSLIEHDEEKEAMKIIDVYIQKYGYLDMNKYMLLSNYCTNLGIIEESIVKSSQVYLTLQANAKLLINMLEGKSVAIIGNGPSALGRRHGDFIDEHDIVIRFNNYQIDGFDDDYGKKTNIWVRCSAGDDLFIRDNINDYDAVVWEADYLHYPTHYDDIDTLYDQVTQYGNKITNFDFAIHNDIRE